VPLHLPDGSEPDAEIDQHVRGRGGLRRGWVGARVGGRRRAPPPAGRLRARHRGRPVREGPGGLVIGGFAGFLRGLGLGPGQRQGSGLTPIPGGGCLAAAAPSTPSLLHPLAATPPHPIPPHPKVHACFNELLNRTFAMREELSHDAGCAVSLEAAFDAIWERLRADDPARWGPEGDAGAAGGGGGADDGGGGGKENAGAGPAGKGGVKPRAAAGGGGGGGGPPAPAELRRRLMHWHMANVGACRRGGAALSAAGLSTTIASPCAPPPLIQNPPFLSQPPITGHPHRPETPRVCHRGTAARPVDAPLGPRRRVRVPGAEGEGSSRARAGGGSFIRTR
jgi:hypothetical protein